MREISVCEMSPQVKAFAAKPEDTSSILETPIMWKARTNSHNPESDLGTCAVTHTCAHIRTHIQNDWSISHVSICVLSFCRASQTSQCPLSVSIFIIAASDDA